MRFSAVLVSLVATVGLVAAQSSSTTSAPVPTNTSSYDKKTVACLDACDESDVNCRAACFGNPHPDEEAVNKTTQCAAKCEQGNGTEEQTAKYAACQQACINSLFLTTTGSITKPTDGASNTKSGSDSKATGDAAKDGESDEESQDGESKDGEADKDSGAGKLAFSAGGAIALALVAFAL